MRRGAHGTTGELELGSPPRQLAELPGEVLRAEWHPLVIGDDSLQAAELQGVHTPAAAPAAVPGRFSALSVFVAVVSIGGFLFGFDTGVISGALPYIRDDLLGSYAGDSAALARWQELIVSAAIIAAGVGSVAGGWLADRLGRRRALMAADVLFTAGAGAMAAARDQWWLIAGRGLVGLGVGLASVTVPIYIAECAPPARRASLVTVNVLLITTGQFAAYVADYAFSFVPGTWRWMLGIAALPSAAQLAGLLLLPESPRWLASRGQAAAAQAALSRLQPGMTLAAAGIVAEGAESAAPAAAGGSSGGGGGGTPWRLLLTRPVLRELHVGVGLQVLQQVAGINTVMYYTPTILQLAGVPKQAALLLALVPSATNALGTLVGLRVIDRHGRRRLLLSSIAAVVLALAALGSAFLAAERHSPAVLPGGGDGGGSTCGAAGPPGGGAPASCTACLRRGCGFCGGAGGDLMAPGNCLAAPLAGDTPACGPPRQLFLHGCPSRYSWLILACLVAYLAAFSPGLGPVPWAVNSEIYPLAVRGVATGLAATANWVSNAAVAQTFLTLTALLGGSGAFFLYAGIACVGFAWTWAVLPETNGLTLEQVQQLFGGEAAHHGGRGPAGGWSGSGTWGGHDRKQRASDDEGEPERAALAARPG